MQLVNVPDSERFLGRAVVLQASKWDNASNLVASLTHIGDTEGEAVFNPNSEYVHGTTPELTGQLPRRAFEAGVAPTLEVPFFAGTPAMLAILSATGAAQAGSHRRQPVTQKTVVVFPEELFLNTSVTPHRHDAVISYSAGTWTKNVGSGPVALAGDDLIYLSQAIWIWAGYWQRPQSAYRHEDAGKNVQTATFVAMLNDDMPDGHLVYTRGNPLTYGIDVETGDVS